MKIIIECARPNDVLIMASKSKMRVVKPFIIFEY